MEAVPAVTERQLAADHSSRHSLKYKSQRIRGFRKRYALGFTYLFTYLVGFYTGRLGINEVLFYVFKCTLVSVSVFVYVDW